MSAALMQSGRLFAQTMLAEERARDALADAQQTPQSVRDEAVRLAAEALHSAGIRFDAAILDFADTVKEALVQEKDGFRLPATLKAVNGMD